MNSLDSLVDHFGRTVPYNTMGAVLEFNGVDYDQDKFGGNCFTLSRMLRDRIKESVGADFDFIVPVRMGRRSVYHVGLIGRDHDDELVLIDPSIPSTQGIRLSPFLQNGKPKKEVIPVYPVRQDVPSKLIINGKGNGRVTLCYWTWNDGMKDYKNLGNWVFEPGNKDLIVNKAENDERVCSFPNIVIRAIKKDETPVIIHGKDQEGRIYTRDNRLQVSRDNHASLTDMATTLGSCPVEVVEHIHRACSLIG